MSAYCNNCFCCGHYLVPRYKRLVNNIFRQNVQHDLDRNNLGRLQFYAIQKPDKLDKSFRYMSETILRYLRHRNRPYVILGVKAMDETMKYCYQQLNTFVNYYLETLHLILEERNDLELIEQAIASFESFCQIREEAPSYQRKYEFFVDRFTQLCHETDTVNQTKYRYLGLRGHYALIRKTTNDELQNDAWKHMNQIIPSIIFNMKVRPRDASSSDIINIITNKVVTKDDVAILADMILRDLFNRAHLNNISICVQPILSHLDDHGKWLPVDFPKYIFSGIMLSIKQHNSYVIIGLLRNHLEDYFERKDKTSIMNVIHDCLISSAADQGVGSTMFTTITSLLKFLTKSFQIESERDPSTNEDEQRFQTAVIDGMRDFAEKLHGFQRIEVIQHILMFVPTLDQEPKTHFRDANLKLQLVLLRTTQKILLKSRSRPSTQPTSQQVATPEPTAYSRQLFDPLLKLLSVPQADIRLITLEILQILVDKQHCADKLRKIRILKSISSLNLPTNTKAVRLGDLPFMQKFGRPFFNHLTECILMSNNTTEIFYAIYCLMSLVTIEANDSDITVDMIQFCFQIQSEILKNSRYPSHSIHALIAAYLNLIAKLYDLPDFTRHVDEIIDRRELHARHLLPPNAFHHSSKETPQRCLFTEETVRRALKTSGYDITRWKTESDVPLGESDVPVRPSYDPLGSNPNLPVNNRNEDISYERISNILHTFGSTRARNDQNKRLINELRATPFEEIRADAREKRQQEDRRIKQLFEEVSIKRSSTNSTTNENPPSTTSRFAYPELFTS